MHFLHSPSKETKCVNTHPVIAKLLYRFQNLIFGFCSKLNAETFEGN